MDSNLISFRSLREENLLLLWDWLNRDHVIEWYTKQKITYQRVKEKYIPYIKGEKPTFAYLILYNETPIGYIQTYKIKDYASYNNLINVDVMSAGLDLYIGEEAFLHKSLGHKIIKKFLQDYTFKLFNVDCCIIGPEPENKIAIKAYEKAGFQYFKTVFNSNENSYEYLMKLDKKAFIS